MTKLIGNFDVYKFVEKYYEPVEDKPGYVWFSKRNMQIINIDVLVASIERGKVMDNNMKTTRNKITKEEATRIIKSEMCKNCGVYLGGGECDKDCRVIQCIEALSNKEDTVPFDFELYQAGLMDLPTEIRSIVATVLDDIKKKIEGLNPVDYVSISSYEGHKGARDIKDDILQIIDKYKNGELSNGEMDKNSPTTRK